MTTIIGISANFHDSACCLLHNGNLVAAAQEERFSRIKHDASWPKKSFLYCLNQGGFTVTDIDCLAYYENPRTKLSRQLCMSNCNLSEERLVGLWRRCQDPLLQIREILGFEGQIEFVDHHQAHAASSYYYSGFPESAIMTVDGVGEWATTTYGYGTDKNLTSFEEVHFPDSLGLLYSAITGYLGFSVNDGEYKVMGLAPYGRPAYVRKIRALIQSRSGGQFELDMSKFDFTQADHMLSPEFFAYLGVPARPAGTPILSAHRDIACSLQVVLEEILLEKAKFLHEKTQSENLCLAGGVALNCVANGRIYREGPFKRLFVQPAAGDAGSSLGAAALAHVKITRQHPIKEQLKHVYLGPGFCNEDIVTLLRDMPLDHVSFQDDEQGLVDASVGKLIDGRVLGWFQGRMEFGPRALGARSILADPRRVEVQDRINRCIKRREDFRPFAPSVLTDRADEHFDLGHDSPFMLETCKVMSALSLPAITHVDGSARPQTVCRGTNPRFARLLEAFEFRTGCPILLNTSFNMRGEPIVCTPVDALLCFIKSGLDTLVLENCIVDRESVDPVWISVISGLSIQGKHDVSKFVYTFM